MMEQAVPGMALAWQAMGDKFILVLLSNINHEPVLEFHLNRDEVKSLSAEIDRYLLQGNGALLHLPPGVG